RSPCRFARSTQAPEGSRPDRSGCGMSHRFALIEIKKVGASDMALAPTCVLFSEKMQQLAGLGQKPNRSPAQRVRFGEEEQQNERALTFEKKSEQAIWRLLRRGAAGGIRTHVRLPAN